MSSPLLYCIFHANLSFSSIEEEEIPNVIERSYMPLLDMVEKYGFCIGIEMSGHTLEQVRECAPAWIEKFSLLNSQGLVELLGSGYQQIIGPLVPHKVNLQNQVIGLQVYQDILGIKPKIAFVNEQAFSKSMVDLYLACGYEAISMEWNNAFSLSGEHWDKAYAHRPTLVAGNENAVIPCIWNDTLLFQQFQRMACGESSLEQYLNYIRKIVASGYECIPIYSNDLEIFNYRPGRFLTEKAINFDEWQKISDALVQLKEMGELVLPQYILPQLDTSIKLDLTSTENPVIVKKQQKYSLSRWAACGKGANYINTLCHRYLKNLDEHAPIDEWKNLLVCWGSDYRTHTTQKKWHKCLAFLEEKSNQDVSIKRKIVSTPLLNYKDNFIEMSNGEYLLKFNRAKGLTLDSICFKENRLSIGTVRHGELELIANSADFYTGTTVIQSMEYKKVTDLIWADEIKYEEYDNNCYGLETILPLGQIGYITKRWNLELNDRASITYEAQISLNQPILGSIRTGSITLSPYAFTDKFWYMTHNGGCSLEKFPITSNTSINHNQAVSILQSTNGGIGVTEGYLAFGIDERKLFELELDKSDSAPFVMLYNSCDKNSYLTRVIFGLQELDDTSVLGERVDYCLKWSLQL